jgi:hypothetical protein
VLSDDVVWATQAHAHELTPRVAQARPVQDGNWKLRSDSNRRPSPYGGVALNRLRHGAVGNDTYQNTITPPTTVMTISAMPTQHARRARASILMRSDFEPRSGWIGADTAMQVSGTYEPVSRECQYFSLRRKSKTCDSSAHVIRHGSSVRSLAVRANASLALMAGPLLVQLDSPPDVDRASASVGTE